MTSCNCTEEAENVLFQKLLFFHVKTFAPKHPESCLPCDSLRYIQPGTIIHEKIYGINNKKIKETTSILCKYQTIKKRSISGLKSLYFFYIFFFFKFRQVESFSVCDRISGGERRSFIPPLEKSSAIRSNHNSALLIKNKVENY